MPRGIWERTEEQKQKLREMQKGIHISDKQKLQISLRHKGKKLSKETKRKMSIAQIGNKKALGIKQSIESRLKRSYVTKGKKHYNWQGGITLLNESLRRGIEYRLWRRDIFIRDRFTCRECGITHTYIEAHHIKPFSKFPELRFDRNNGLTLCKKCHKETDTYGSRLRKGVGLCLQQ